MEAWLSALRLVAESMRTPQRPVHGILHRLPEADISILASEDAALARIGVAHAAGRPAASVHFAVLAACGRAQFFGISLLRARQARLEGNEVKASEAYDRALREAMASGPDFLLDVVAGERSA